MAHNMGDDTEGGISISVPVPAESDDLYSVGATDDVLTFLSRNRHEEFTQRELADAVDQPKSTVGRAVDLLEENGLVVCEYEGNQKRIAINQERLEVPDDPYLSIPQAQFRAPARAAVEEIRNALDDVMAIVLYGSVASGDADRRSDIDLWILVDEDRAKEQREANAVGNVLEDTRFDGERYQFHIVVESVESVPSFTDEVEEIVSSGITLYSASSYETLRNLIAHGDL